METEAIGPVKPGRAANRKVSGYVSATLKMWRFKRQYEQYLEEVRRRRLAGMAASRAGEHASLWGAGRRRAALLNPVLGRGRDA